MGEVVGGRKEGRVYQETDKKRGIGMEWNGSGRAIPLGFFARKVRSRGQKVDDQ